MVALAAVPLGVLIGMRSIMRGGCGLPSTMRWLVWWEVVMSEVIYIATASIVGLAAVVCLMQHLRITAPSKKERANA